MFRVGRPFSLLPRGNPAGYLAFCRRFSWCVLALVAICIGTSSCSRREPTSDIDHHRLVLTEARSIPLTGTRIRGGAIAADGHILYWTDSTVHLIRPAAVEPVRVCPSSAGIPVAASFSDGGATLELIAGSQLLTTTTASTSNCRQHTIPVQPAHRVLSAARLDRGWLLLVSTSSQEERLLLLESVPAPHFVRPRLIATMPASNDWRFISPAGERFIIGDQRGDMRWELRPIAEGPAISPSPLALSGIQLILPPQAATPDWLALPVIHAGDSYLQTVADTRSDVRVIRRYDQSGRLLGQSLVPAPIGLPASSSDGKVVLAYRRASQEGELVVYASRRLSAWLSTEEAP